jgi:hypothetical protein
MDKTNSWGGVRENAGRPTTKNKGKLLMVLGSTPEIKAIQVLAPEQRSEIILKALEDGSELLDAPRNSRHRIYFTGTPDELKVITERTTPRQRRALLLNYLGVAEFGLGE